MRGSPSRNGGFHNSLFSIWCNVLREPRISRPKDPKTRPYYRQACNASELIA
jgi:hypothetical protein